MPRAQFTAEGLRSPERKATEQEENVHVQKIIAERRNAAEAEWAKNTWRTHLAMDIASPRRITPRFRCKTPSWGGPLYADRPLHVPLPPGINHQGFVQRNYWGDARIGSVQPPLPRRLPSELPAPRLEVSPVWKTTLYEHPWGWKNPGLAPLTFSSK